MKKIKVLDKESAWEIANQLFPTDYELDKKKIELPECKIYVSADEGYDGYEIVDENESLTIRLGETGATLKIEIEQSRYQELAIRADKMREACYMESKRVQAAELEVQRLKAKLYDVLVEGKCKQIMTGGT